MNSSNINLSIISPVYFSQKRTPALDYLLDSYSGLPLEMRKQIEFVFVDDCSPFSIELGCKAKQLNYQLLRIEDNIPWNQGGARNLGVAKAKSSKILLTDIDHFFSEDLLSMMLKTRKVKRLYKFKINRDSGESWTGSPNIFFTTKEVFYKALGYDEEFAGNYGYEDVHFLELHKRLGTSMSYLTRRFKAVNNLSMVLEDDYHTLQRDTTKNKFLFDQKMEQMKKGNVWQSHSRKILNFQFEVVEENYQLTE